MLWFIYEILVVLFKFQVFEGIHACIPSDWKNTYTCCISYILNGGIYMNSYISLAFSVLYSQPDPEMLRIHIHNIFLTLCNMIESITCGYSKCVSQDLWFNGEGTFHFYSPCKKKIKQNMPHKKTVLILSSAFLDCLEYISKFSYDWTNIYKSSFNSILILMNTYIQNGCFYMSAWIWPLRGKNLEWPKNLF